MIQLCGGFREREKEDKYRRVDWYYYSETKNNLCEKEKSKVWRPFFWIVAMYTESIL